ncbi:MAG: SgcJ/EcaC family oxidoreductase [Pseudomonadota bacterium]
MTHDIHSLIGRLETAWNRKDAAAFAACFDEQAEFGHIMGGKGFGRAAIREGHEALFSSLYAVSVVTYSVVATRPLGDWAMAVSLAQTLDFESQGRVRTVRCAPELVVRMDGDHWVISVFRNRRIDRGDTAAVWPVQRQNHAA